MLSGRSDLVVRREPLEELDVGDQSRPAQDSLEQVVTEERFSGPAFQDPGKCLDVIDALAGVRAASKEILVDIGGRRCIGIDARRAGGEPLEERRVAIGRHGGSDTWLKDRIALDDPARVRIEDRPVERMGHRPHEANGGASRQARVRVEGDHVSDRHRHVQPGPHERRAVVPQEQLVELLELATLALPSHPLALAGIPDAAAVEQEESGPRGGNGTMAPVEPVDPLDGGLEQPIISRHAFRRRVHPVREESEVDGALQIR